MKKHPTDILHSLKIYNLLLSLYPKEYKKRYKEQMLIVFKDLYREQLEEKGKIGFGFWWKILADTGFSMIEEHLYALKYQKILTSLFSPRVFLYILILPIITTIISIELTIFSSYIYNNLNATNFNPFVSAYFGLIGTPSTFTALICSFIAIRSSKNVGKYITFGIIPALIPFSIQCVNVYTTTFGNMNALSIEITGGVVGLLSASVAGISTALIGQSISRKTGLVLPRLNLNLFKKVCILSILFGLLLTFFTGSFNNTYGTELWEKPSRLYITRGVPFRYSGVTSLENKVSYPYLALPFFKEKVNSPMPWRKIIDVPMFLATIVFYSIISIIPAAILSYFLRKNIYFLNVCGLLVILLFVVFNLWGITAP